MLAGVTGAISVGVILGLVIGKPLGLMLLSWLAVRSGLTSLPADLSWRAIEQAKMGILVGSLVAGVTGYCLLRWALPAETPRSSAASS